VVSRQHFLQERNEFIDKLTDHEAELKKRFSEKVYNLLKDIKNRGSPEGKERGTLFVMQLKVPRARMR
jgi:hypothetical protein